MINSAGVAGLSGLSASMGHGHAALDARLARYAMQRSNGVDSLGQKTAEGMARIPERAGKISEVDLIQKTAEVARASAVADMTMIERLVADRTDGSIQMSNMRTLQQEGSLGTRLDIYV